MGQLFFCVQEESSISPRPHTSHADPRFAAAQALSVACNMGPARVATGHSETVFRAQPGVSMRGCQPAPTNDSPLYTIRLRLKQKGEPQDGHQMPDMLK